jgi:hypothetical protein
MQNPHRVLLIVTATAVLSAAAYGQSSFPGFTAGNLVLSRSVYVGDATTVITGQALPPVCPSTAACGTGMASDNGAFPSSTSTNNVWNNDAVDGSFGITSPIYLDQITPTGTVVNTLARPQQPGLNVELQLEVRTGLEPLDRWHRNYFYGLRGAAQHNRRIELQHADGLRSH